MGNKEGRRKKRRKEEKEGEARGWEREGGRMDTQRQNPNKTQNYNKPRDHSRKGKLY